MYVKPLLQLKPCNRDPCTRAYDIWKGACGAICDERGSANGVAQVFMNIVLDEAFEEKAGGEKVAIGMIVSTPPCPRSSDRPANHAFLGHPR